MHCLDTSAAIDFLRGDENVLKLLHRLEDEELFLTQINVFELFVGYFRKIHESKKQSFLLTDFLESFKILELDIKSTIKSAEIKASLMDKGQDIDALDSMISGICLRNNIKKIITKNKKHFERVKGLEVISY